MKTFRLHTIICVALLLMGRVESARGQTALTRVDSIKKVLITAPEDTVKVHLLGKLCRNLMVAGRYEDAIAYAKEGETLAKQLNFKRGEGDLSNQMGVMYNELSNFSAALESYDRAIKIFEEIGYKRGIASVYSNIGNTQYHQGEFLSATKSSLECLRISEQIGDKRSAANAHMNLGNIYFSQAYYTEALESYKASLKLSEELGDKQLISFVNGNIGNFYFQRGNYAEALKYYEATMKIAQEAGNRMSVSNCLNNIGNIYFQQKKYEEALNNQLASLKVKEELGDKDGAVITYQNLGNIYLETKKIGLAGENFSKALAISREVGSKEGEKNSYYYLCVLDSIKGDYKSAFSHFMNYTIMKDSILSEESDKQIQNLKVQYETAKKDQQIKTQSLQLQNQLLERNAFRTRLYYGAGLVALILGVTGLLLYLRNRRKKKEYETRMVTTELKALKSQLNPHFIFNALNSIKSYIQSNPQSGAEYLTRFSLLMRGVLEGSEEKEISLGEEMQLMQHYIELERLRLKHNVNYSITYGEGLNKEEIMIPPLITQPIIENAVWHGLTTLEREGDLHIHNYLSGNVLYITVSNTFENEEQNPAISIPTRRKSFGMKITRERLSLLKQTSGKEGTVNIENLAGETKVTITIPLSEN